MGEDLGARLLERRDEAEFRFEWRREEQVDVRRDELVLFIPSENPES